MVLACVEPYDLSFLSQKEILFVEADINDYDSLQYVTIKKNIPEPKNIVYFDVDNAKVQIIEGGSRIIDCPYTSLGRYKLPDNFRSKNGTDYQLKMIIDGKTYQSSIEKAERVAPIEKIYSQFAAKDIDLLEKKVDGHRIFLETKDIPKIANYYLWQWKLYEKQSYCKSCYGGRYFTAPSPLGRCVDDQNLMRRGLTYDYLCSSNCWEIKYSNQVNIMSDLYATDETIKGRFIADIPFYQFKNSLIEVQQYSISKSAFDYFNIMVNQTQRNGTLADTPPAGLIGNIKNTMDKTEPIGGIFMVSSKTSKVFVIERIGIQNAANAVGLVVGRDVNPEPAGNDTSRPPFAPCIESKERTSKKPFGWVE